jgi:hypothetical protein
MMDHMTIDQLTDDLLDAFDAKLEMAVQRKVAELTTEVRKSLADMKGELSNANSLSLKALSFASTTVATPLPRGSFDMSTAYRGGDVASYNGSTWLCLRSVTGRVPGTNSDWAKVTADKPVKAPKK